MAKKKEPTLADRDGTYSPDLEDRRRIAVSELIMVAQSAGQLTAGDLLYAVKHNVVEAAELELMGALVVKRLTDIFQGGSQF